MEHQEGTHADTPGGVTESTQKGSESNPSSCVVGPWHHRVARLIGRFIPSSSQRTVSHVWCSNTVKADTHCLPEVQLEGLHLVPDATWHAAVQEIRTAPLSDEDLV